ncbi:MAG: hypothetical protein WBQ17_08120 [Rhizomicrobium sp.]
MKFGFLTLTLAVLTASTAMAAPFASTVVAAKIGYKSTQYSIKKGHVLKNIAVPVVNSPVHMMVTDITPYDPGVGEATIMATAGTTMQWIGNDTWAAEQGKREYGGSQGPGTHMLWANYDASVDIEVQNQRTIQIRNKSAGPQTVIVTFTW